MFYLSNMKTALLGKQKFVLPTDSTCTAELTSFVSLGKNWLWYWAAILCEVKCKL